MQSYPSISFTEKDFVGSHGSYYASKKINFKIPASGWAVFQYEGKEQQFYVSSCKETHDGLYDLQVVI